MLQVKVSNVGNVFSRVLYISTHISLGFLFRGNVEADIRCAERSFDCKFGQKCSH